MKAYILKLTFEDIEPVVWRRVVLPAGATFNRLHELIQRVTNFQSEWTDQAIHSFAIELDDVFITDNDGIHEESTDKKFAGKTLRRPTSLKIDTYIEKYGAFDYVYDLGDSWRIHIELEETVEDYYFGYPTLLAGEGTAPPEDVGGVPGYAHFLSVYHDSTHPDYLEMHKWAESQKYEPLDIDWTNRILKNMNYKKNEWANIHHERYKIISDKYRGSDFIDVEKIANKDLIAKYIIACTGLYGIVSFSKFREIYNEQNGTSLTTNQLSALLDTSDFKLYLEKEHVRIKYRNFVHEAVEVFGDFERLSEVAVGKPYYVPAKDELLNYCDEFYIQRTPQQEQLRDMLAKDFFKGNLFLAEQEVLELVSLIQVLDGDVNHVIQEFSTRLDFKDMQSLNHYLPVVVGIINTTRIWEHRGHTPHELASMANGGQPLSPMPISIVNGNKIGRNDPCLCGSGKKYKKCCGK